MLSTHMIYGGDYMNRKKGGTNMAVLAKPIGVPFELDPSKRGDSQKVIERSKRHPSKKEKSK